MKIIFHENQLCFRGTSNALFDYAFFCEKTLGHTSIILYPKNSPSNYPAAIERFKQHFKVHAYEDVTEIEGILEQENADLLYAINCGKKAEVVSEKVRTVIHAVFKHHEPYADVYAYVSEWLADEMTKGELPYVPHMIHLPHTDENYREHLGIPQDAVVFGRYGGDNTFDLKFVHKVVQKVAAKNPNMYFLFMGTNDFVKKGWFQRKYPNIIFLPPSVDPLDKTRFINSCDAHLHARKQGESFGIAVGEFSIKNKPVLTWGGSKEKAHLKILGNKAIVYSCKNDLFKKLSSFKPDPKGNYDAYSEHFCPEKVMKKFDEVFIRGTHHIRNHLS